MANRLQSLELQGYKTFASKTEFRFPGQLTAIVGPNGSGKSNIADGVRWVLGEQAYSLLRGKKTIDMIFSGSEQRARASMASVSITFDNQNGWLPVEFSEVTITRRAYRSGENEYLLNNQRVRLKEINELLANSGLGERTYTIIGQGLVDTALSLKPEERRRFFEEASGIGLYRARREEAIQRLDKTLHNMERSNDILNELKPRLGYLEKSKEKARQFQQIQDDLHVLLKDWYGYHWHAVQRELKYAVDFHNKQNETLNMKREEKQQLEAKLNQIQTELNEKRNKLADWHLELSKFHSTKEDITREIAVLDERERSIKERSRELDNEIIVLADEASQQQTELGNLEQSGEKSKLEMEQVGLALNEANDKLNQRYIERNKFEKLIGDLQKQIINCESEIIKSESRMDHLNHQKENDKNELQILATNQDGVKELIRKSDDAIKAIDKEVEEIQSNLRLNLNALENLLNQRSTLKEKIDAGDRKHREIELARFKLTAELKVINEAEESMTGFTSGSKEFFQAVKGQKIHGKFALLLDYLKVPQEYELALSAALGDVIEGIILDEGTSAEKVLDFLEKSRIPRTVFLPKWWESKAPTMQKADVQAKKASELISVSSDSYLHLIKDLLSTTLIVGTARDAEQLVKQLPLGMKVVTLKGEVFDTRGMITAGNEFRVKNLTRKREKETIVKDIETFKTESQSIQKDLDGLKNDFLHLDEELKKLSEQDQQLQQKNQQISIEKHKAEIERSQKQDNLKDINTRIDQLKLFISNREKEIADLTGLLKNNKEKLANDQNQLSSYFLSVKELPVEDIRSSVMDLTSEKAVIEEMANQHATRVEEKKKTIEDLQVKIKTQQEKQAEFKLTLESMLKEKERLGQTDAEVSTQIKELSEKISPLEEEVESGIKQQGNFLEDVDGGRNQYSIAERHTLQSQMKVDRLRDQMEDLRKKIQEDFGLISDENEEGLTSPKPLPIDGMIATLPDVSELPGNLEDQIKQQKSYLRRIGPINPEAQKEYKEVYDRVQFLTDQLQDLDKAEKDLRQVVNELDELMKKEFLKTFRKVEEEFRSIFGQLFSGGTARLFIEDEENIMDSGIEIEATLPGKRKQELALLSGGERSLTAVALIFALLKISPTPFCILDEVDAMLDESNVVRFGELLRELSESTQFIVITHNRNTVQLADTLYGVTMGKDTVSQVISLKMDELTEEMVQ